LSIPSQQLIYLNNKLYLKPYKNETFRSRYNLLGFELREVISGNFVVRFIFPELVAASSALQEGDIITAINSIKAKDIS
jgi:hypothetical protein